MFFFSRFPSKADLNAALQPLIAKVNAMSQQLTDLQAKVAAALTVEESAITLIQGLKSQLDAALANNDTAALQALSDSLGAESDKLAAAITANTPASA